ncbi:MAG: acetylglutamate kinase [Planctomycetota bacterium]|nr:acetylglutamate kinase [Planctomycetota bacterium]
MSDPPVLDAIRKAKVLIEALGWIRAFRGKYVVIKLGGSALEEQEAVRSLLTDVIFMEAVGMKPILIHGGGKAITAAMSVAGLEPRWVQGRRHTDDATMEIVAKTLAHEICGGLAHEIELQGGKAAPLHYATTPVLTGEKLQLPDEKGQPLDLGLVGHVTGLDPAPIEAALAQNAIPILPSVALDASGNKLNVNADTAAAAVARFLKAEKLVFLSDVPGLFLDPKEPSSLLPHVSASRCRRLLTDGIITAGMIPKIEASLEALEVGVGKVHLVDGRMPHSVLLEIYSDKGVGTEIVPD